MEIAHLEAHIARRRGVEKGVDRQLAFAEAQLINARMALSHCGSCTRGFGGLEGVNKGILNISGHGQQRPYQHTCQPWQRQMVTMI